MSTSEVFRCVVSYTIGDGSTVSFWRDRWCAQLSLQSMFPHLFNAVVRKNHRVWEFSGTNGWRWHKILQGFMSGSSADDESILALKELLCTITLSDVGDAARWRWSNSEVFTVKSMYNFIQKGGISETKFVMLWRIKISLKVKILGWLVLMKKVLTWDNLVKRGWSGEITCPLCLDESEIIDYLFWNCYVSRAVGMFIAKQRLPKGLYVCRQPLKRL